MSNYITDYKGLHEFYIKSIKTYTEISFTIFRNQFPTFSIQSDSLLQTRKNNGLCRLRRRNLQGVTSAIKNTSGTNEQETRLVGRRGG